MPPLNTESDFVIAYRNATLYIQMWAAVETIKKDLDSGKEISYALGQPKLIDALKSLPDTELPDFLRGVELIGNPTVGDKFMVVYKDADRKLNTHEILSQGQ